METVISSIIRFFVFGNIYIHIMAPRAEYEKKSARRDAENYGRRMEPAANDKLYD